MPKTEVLATSFILTLTVISTVPVQSVNLQCNCVFLDRQKLAVEKKKINYHLAQIKLNKFKKYKKYIDRGTVDFTFSNTLNNFSPKIKQGIWNFDSFNLSSSFFDGNQLIKLTELKNNIELAFSFTQPSFSYNFINELTFPNIETKTFTTNIWTQQTIDSALEYQKTWIPIFYNRDTSDFGNPKPELKIGRESLPMISLIISSLLCLIFPKKSQEY